MVYTTRKNRRKTVQKSLTLVRNVKGEIVRKVQLKQMMANAKYRLRLREGTGTKPQWGNYSKEIFFTMPGGGM